MKDISVNLLFREKPVIETLKREECTPFEVAEGMTVFANQCRKNLGYKGL